MSNYQTLGVDETKPAALFVRIVNPNEIDKVALEMARLIKSYYPGIDILNLSLWRKLGADVGGEGNPLQQFLQNYIQVARETGTCLSAANKDWWASTLYSRFGTRQDDLADYIKAMLDMIRAGTMSDIVLKPYGYTPTEAGQDIVKSAFPKLLITVAIVAGVIVLSNTLIPQITTSIGAARIRRLKAA